MHLVVDAANVVGSRPDGWWRDRAGAARRLLDRLAGALTGGALVPPVTVVLEGAARAGAPAGPGRVDGLRVVHADRDGDSAIVELVSGLVAGLEPDAVAGLKPAAGADAGADAASDAGGVTVVTADRALRARVEAVGARTVGPSWLRDRL